MREIGHRFKRKFLKDERGQSAALIIVVLFALTAMSAAGIETGHVYYAYRLLKASTNSAALAAAQAMPDIGSSGSATPGTAWGNLIIYSSQSGEKNASNMLSSDSISASFYCSTTMQSPPFNVGCQTPPLGEGSCGGASTCNAISVRQTASINLWFGGLVGVRTMTIAATGTAAARGGSHMPYNIAIIIDTTHSMTNSAPSSDGCGSGATQIVCAIYGAKQMLLSMYPCVGNASTTCTSASNYADAVSMYAFPAVAAGNTSKDTTCPTSNPPTVPYTFPVSTTGSGQNLILPTSGTDAGTYEIVPFNQTYKATNGATSLQSTDPLAVAVGAGGGSCQGLQAPGGQGTYYAQVIYAAQAALVAQQSSEATAGYTTENVMIILSDGDATAGNSLANTSAGGNRAGSQIVSLSGTLNGTCTSSSNCTNANSTTTTYPSALGECGQAVQAAQAATQAGTKVYTVAMGSETSGSCLTDANYTIASGSTYGAIAYPSGSYSGQACNAIEAMASDVNKFYSDNTGGCPASSANSTFTTIGGIFTAVGDSLTAARLIPDGT